MRTPRTAAAAALVLALGGGLLGTQGQALAASDGAAARSSGHGSGHGPGRSHDHDREVRQLVKAVSGKKVLRHLRAFQEVADRYGDRAAGRPGYDASVRYVVRELRRAGYRPEVQQFDFTYVEENSALERTSPPERAFEDGVEFIRNSFDTGIPEGEATGPLVVVDPGSATSGCESTDFTGFTPGSIALVQRGTCPFSQKVLNAQAAGAAGVVVWNNQPGLVGMIGEAPGLTIPAVFAVTEAGQELAATPGATVRVSVDYTEEERTSTNVLAETRGGNDDNVVMAGAHLDGIQDGPGINDNGSGSAALLETALQMAPGQAHGAGPHDSGPHNTVRFAWWGAEESGLLGSEAYVESLGDAAEKIALYLNFDMVASPNYTFGIYDGDDSGGTAEPGFIPEGSAQIEDLFEEFYTERGEPFVDSEFSGRSDYGPFIAVGIPAGGLFTGAEVEKTPEEAALFGGVAGVSLDPCYHRACDNLTGEGQDQAVYDQLREDYRLVGNVNLHALDVNADAIATAVLSYGLDTSAVNGVVSQEPQHPGHGHGKGKGKGHGHDRDGARAGSLAFDRQVDRMAGRAGR